jgi:hypothetical protein
MGRADEIFTDVAQLFTVSHASQLLDQTNSVTHGKKVKKLRLKV